MANLAAVPAVSSIKKPDNKVGSTSSADSKTQTAGYNDKLHRPSHRVTFNLDLTAENDSIPN